MKKIIALLLAVLVLVPLTAFGSAPTVKVGVILVHDENTGYDSAHINGIKTAAAALGIADDQIIWKYNVSEDESCYDTATDLVEQGCTYIFSDSYGHQSYMQQAATENPDVTFVAMTGDTAALLRPCQFQERIQRHLSVPVCFRRCCRHEACPACHG